MTLFDFIFLDTIGIGKLVKRSPSTASRWFEQGLHNTNEGGRRKETNIVHLFSFLRDNKPNLQYDIMELHRVVDEQPE